MEYLCLVEDFERHLGDDKEVSEFILHHFKSPFTNIKKNFDVLALKDNKIYLNPIEIIDSLCEVKRKLSLERVKDRLTIFNLDTFFPEKCQLSVKKRLKKVFRQVLPRVYFTGLDISLTFEDTFRLYNGFRNNINNDLEPLDRIINGIFNRKELDKIYNDIKQDQYTSKQNF